MSSAPTFGGYRAPARPVWLARHLSAVGVLGAAVLALLLVFSVFPLLLIVQRTLLVQGVISLDNFATALGRPANLTALVNTLLVSTLTTAFAVAVGTVLAWLLTRTDLPWRGGFRGLLLVPYLIPPYIGAIAWTQLLNARVGYLNLPLMALFGLERGPFDVHSWPGLIWVMGLYDYPLVLVTVSAALAKMDPSLEEAARDAGAGIWRTLRSVTLPLVLPSIAAGGLLVFTAAAANFGVPAIVGNPARIFVVPTRIVASLSTGTVSGSGLREATVLATLLMLLALAALALGARVTRAGRFTTITGKSTQPTLVSLGRARWPVAAVLALFTLLSVVFPLAAVAATSLLHGWGQAFTPENLTLDNYRYILTEHHMTGPGLRNSLWLAAVSATIAVAVGAVIAYLKVKLRHRVGAVMDIVATLPYATPGTVLALALIIAWSGAYGLNLYNTFGILLVAYVVKDLAFGMRTAGGALEQVHDSLEEAARASGATWLRTFRQIVLPLIRPALIGGWFLVFIPAFRELTMSILLYGSSTPTAGVALYELQSGGYYQSAAALSVVVLAIVLAGNWLAKRLTRGAFGI